MKIFKEGCNGYTEEALTMLADVEDVFKTLTKKWLTNGMSIDQISFLVNQTMISLALDVLLGLNDKQKGIYYNEFTSAYE